jgi:hypothetical protein
MVAPMLGNIAGKPLTDPDFAAVWAAIDAKGIPVFIHPTAPTGIADRFHLRHPVDPVRVAHALVLGEGRQ